ncbi:MAG: DNA methyltransferase [Myxococcales bacterium]|nr:DNA methyltransferase [Myxococcales bacterium]
MIKYLGSKRTLLPLIRRTVAAIGSVRSAIDLFSGTSRVGHALKGDGLQVYANDHTTYASIVARCYVQADAQDVERPARLLLAELNALPGEAGYVTATFCQASRFFHPKNGARIDAIRQTIAAKALPAELEAVLLVALMEAADRVDSTTGVQMAYLKQWAPRAHNDLQLRMPNVLPRARHGKGQASQLDAAQAVQHLTADLAYIDPPYNSHKYLGNYHIWESLVLWDKPPVYGVACKRIDTKERASAFNSKRLAAAAMQAVIDGVQAPWLLVSFNNEGFFDRATLLAMLQRRGHVGVIETDFKRYVGAQIGVFNPQGQKVGAVSHLRNIEYLFVVAPDPDALATVLGQVQTSGPQLLAI